MVDIYEIRKAIGLINKTIHNGTGEQIEKNDTLSSYGWSWRNDARERRRESNNNTRRIIF